MEPANSNGKMVLCSYGVMVCCQEVKLGVGEIVGRMPGSAHMACRPVDEQVGRDRWPDARICTYGVSTCR
jgi:hypothetical protein